MRRVESILKSHDHHVIWDAFKYLEGKGMIARTKSRLGGRPEFIFEIRERGLELLITEDPRPKIFWNIVLFYCYNSKNEISLERIKKLYKHFIDKHLKHSYDRWYTFELDIFNRASNDWLNRINSCGQIPLNQIILETLAIHPKLTFEGLRKFVNAEDDKIRKMLISLNSIRYMPAVIDNAYVKSPRDIGEKWQLLSSRLIKVKADHRGHDTYQLSLYGVLFVLLLLRHNDLGKLKHGLYNSKEPFLEYCDIIASNYPDTIPLIFKKWSLLKRILKTIAAYNFDIILDPQFRDSTMKGLSAFKRFPEDDLHITSGNKYFFESAKSIIEISRRQLGEVQTEGIIQSRNFVERMIVNFPNVENARKLVENKIQAVSRLIWEITVNLEPIGYDPMSFKETELHISKQETERLSQFFDIDSVEKPFAEEITFLYYLNLNDEWYFHIRDPWKMDQTEDIVRPLWNLLTILEEDTEIREWFSPWINNLLKYQEEVLQTMREFYNKIRIPS